MQLHRVHLVNFRLHADTDIVLGPGLTGLVGPNGAGKTTVLEAIAWAFYGTPAARGAKDSIRRVGAPAREPVLVEVEFSLGPHDYRVVRKMAGAELFQDGGHEPIANSASAVTERLSQLLTLSREEFFNTYFTGQKELTVMAALGPSDRGKFLSRLLGYEKLRLAQRELRAARTALRGELAGLQQGLESVKVLREDREAARNSVAAARERLVAIQGVMEEAQRRLAALSPQWVELQRRRETTLAMRGELSMAEQRLVEAGRDCERLDRELAEALMAKEALQKLAPDVERASALRDELERWDRAAQAAGRRRTLTGQLETVSDELDRLNTRIEEMGEPREATHAARTALTRVQAELKRLEVVEEKARTEWVRDRQDAETRHRSLQDQYRTLKEDRARIVEAGADGECPTCTRPLGEEFESVLAAVGRQLEEVEANGKYLKQRVKQLETEPEALRQARREHAHHERDLDAAVQSLAEAEAVMRAREAADAEHRRLCDRRKAIEGELAGLQDDYDAERHETVRGEVRLLADAVKRATELSVRAERAESLGTDAEAAEQALTACEDRVGGLKRAMADAGFRDEDYERLGRAVREAEEVLQARQVEEATVRGDLRAEEAALAGVEQRLREWEARTERVQVLGKSLSVHDELDAAFEDLRRDLNARLRPDLSELASLLIADLTDGRYQELELDEQYRLVLVEDGVPKRVMSGGEEDIANLALRLAISQMVSERAGLPLSLLVLDEIFGGLDDERREGVIGLLRGLANRFPQVILITHIESVKHGVDRVLRVALDVEARRATVREEEASVGEEDAAA